MDLPDGTRHGPVAPDAVGFRRARDVSVPSFEQREFSIMRRAHVLRGFVGICGLLAVVPAFGQQAPQGNAPAPTAPAAKVAAPDRAALEKAFEEQLSGCALVGTFTVDGNNKGDPKEERYEISKITKVKDDYWLFLARIKYGNNDVTVPITLKVLWAGDTPVISLTDVAIPGLGTFTSRTMFYGDRYAGTWQHGKVGGLMFGRIEKLPAAGTNEPKPEGKPTSKPEAKPEGKPAPKPKAKPEGKPVPKPEAKPEGKPPVKPETPQKTPAVPNEKGAP